MEGNRVAMSFEEVGEWLDEVANSIPDALFEGLNGGVVLLKGIRLSPHAQGNDLYILGQYNHDPYGLGRYIQVFYGSFVQVYKGKSPKEQKEGLRTLLLHELTHHVESLAGVRDLEVKDAVFLKKYEENKREKTKTNNRTTEKFTFGKKRRTKKPKLKNTQE